MNKNTPIRVGVIVPDRGDRPQLFANCKRLIMNQTLKPAEVIFVNYKPETNFVDITERYKTGYNHASKLNLDVIAFMENDDWYHETYLEQMVAAWQRAECPDIFGTDYTIFYHIKLFAHYTHTHIQRSMAFCTLIKPGLEFNWGPMDNPYTDSQLFKELKRSYALWHPEKLICMGIKHGIGLPGGEGHTTKLERFGPGRGTSDADKEFLRNTVDKESFDLYNILSPIL